MERAGCQVSHAGDHRPGEAAGGQPEGGRGEYPAARAGAGRSREAIQGPARRRPAGAVPGSFTSRPAGPCGGWPSAIRCWNFRELVLSKRFTPRRPIPTCAWTMPWVSRPGGDLFVVTFDGPEGEPRVRKLLNGALGPGHVHGMDLRFDGMRPVRLRLCEGEGQRAGRGLSPDGWGTNSGWTTSPPTSSKIGIDGKSLRQLTDHRLWSDLDPTYLPDGAIAFVSERCGASLQCNEMDKDETSCNLYVIQPDGGGMRRLSASKDGDYLPQPGRRHDRLYPLGIRAAGLGQHPVAVDRASRRHGGRRPVQTTPQRTPGPWRTSARSPGTDNRQLAAIATGHHTLAAGPVVVIAPSEGMNDSARAIGIVTPGVRPPEGGMSGPRWRPTTRQP